jgi:hypothetical protein
MELIELSKEKKLLLGGAPDTFMVQEYRPAGNY